MADPTIREHLCARSVSQLGWIRAKREGKVLVGQPTLQLFTAGYGFEAYVIVS